jgi:hypothetical protein
VGAGERAVELAAAATQARSRLALPRPKRLDMRWQVLLGWLRETLGADRYDTAWQRGRRMETTEAVKAALLTGTPA